MKTLILFTVAMVAWVSYEASATETSCTIGSHGNIFLPHQHHALIGHSFLNQSGTVRIQCMMLCWRHSRCLSFNHNDISGICQLNDASKEDFPDSYKQDDGFSYFGGSSNKAKPLPEEAMMTTKTKQETLQAKSTTTDRITTVSTELSTPLPDTTSAKAGPTVYCPKGVFGLTNDSYARTSVQWREVFAYDQDGLQNQTTCRDDDEGKTVVSGDSFKAGTTTVTCKASDAAGNPGQCTFLVTIAVCNIICLGMESGAIADHQIIAGNVLNDDYANYGPALARLNSHGSWCGNYGFWIQVDFLHTVDIYGLIIQGRYESNEYVMYFYLKYSNDGNTWIDMKDSDGSIKEYVSQRRSDDHDVVVSVQTTSQRMIRSRFIRIQPWWWNVNQCMRFEIISCN